VPKFDAFTVGTITAFTHRMSLRNRSGSARRGGCLLFAIALRMMDSRALSTN
jgi:hypothetical protein